MIKTTVPFTKQIAYKQILFGGSVPVFTELPIQEDFDIAVRDINFDQKSPRIVLDFDHFIVSIARDRSEGLYYLSHEFSLDTGWSHYALESNVSWDLIIQHVKKKLHEQVDDLEAHLRKIKRILIPC